jgi:predicted nucleotidyltransferase
VNFINDRRLEVESLCRDHHVAQLELFGSAATGDFDSAESDIDFLVRFLPLSPAERADAYFGLLHGLEDLFGRKIDLVTTEAIENRWFLRTIQAQRKLLYAA